MANRPWPDEVLGQLAKHALPPSYVRRFMEELSDHYQDIMEDHMSTEASALSRLGEPKQVADAAVVAYRRRSFLGRHPTAAFLVFGVSPIVLQMVQLIVGIVVFKVVTTMSDRFGVVVNNGSYVPKNPILYEAMDYVITLIGLIVPSILAAIFFGKLAERLGMGKKWMLVSCIAIAAMAILPCWSILIGMDVAGHIYVVSRLSFPTWHGCFSQVSQVVQITVPLAIGWWFLRRTRAQHRLQLAS
jgi:hypothetical protein